MTIPGGFTPGYLVTSADMNSLPAGKVGRSTFGVSSQTGIASSATDVTSSSITFTAVAGRRYRISAFVPMLQVTSAGLVSVLLNRAGADVLYMYRQDLAAGARDYRYMARTEVPGGGSVTYKLRALTTAGTLTIENAVAEGEIWVEDIGVG